MYNLVFAGDFDLTTLLFSAFVLFFFGLIFYIRREDRREGYPLEDEATGRLEGKSGLFFTALPKTFDLPHGQGKVVKPNASRNEPAFKAERTSRVDGSPLEPVGDPLLAGVGPGSYALRADRPDVTFHGDARIVPLRAAPDFFIDKKDPELRGMTVVGADGVAAGVVSDIWVDRAEYMVRYLEVELTPAAWPPNAPKQTVLLPFTMSVVSRSEGKVKVSAILGSQFAGVPQIRNPDQITLYEEERVIAYFGAGYLYATPARTEPLI